MENKNTNKYASFTIDEILVVCKAICENSDTRPLNYYSSYLGKRTEGEFIIFVRPYEDINPAYYFMVYTSCDPDTGISRDPGKDAIRIVFKGKKVKEKEPRINRTEGCLERLADKLGEMIVKHKPTKNIIKNAQCCPKCREGFIIDKTGRYGKFKSCSRFPVCRYAEDTYGSLKKYKLDERDSVSLELRKQDK